MSEVRGITFKVLSWDVGQTVAIPTSVILQGVGTNPRHTESTEKAIFEFCKAEGVACEKITNAPKYETPVKAKL